MSEISEEEKEKLERAEYEKRHKEHVEELKQSGEVMGELHPVVFTQYGLAAGTSRLEANPNWRKVTITAPNLYEHYRIMLHDNKHERKPDFWIKEVLNKEAEALVLPPPNGLGLDINKGEVTDRLVRESSLPEWKVYELLDDKYKAPEQRKAGIASAEAKDLQISPKDILDESKSVVESTTEKEKVSKKRQRKRSKEYKEFGKVQYTEAEQTLETILSRYNIKYKAQVSFERAGEFTEDGKPKTYIADILIDNIVIEIEGAGTSSDSAERDDFFFSKGCYVVHVPNIAVFKHGEVIGSLVAAFYHKWKRGYKFG